MSAPAFQHRHYKAIVAVIADMRADHHSSVCGAADEFEDRLVRLFERDNYGFSEDRFRKAARRDPKMHGKDKVR